MPKEKAEKSLCMSELRHAEYYGMQEVFDSLYAKSNKNEIFTNLMNIILKRENILLAYRNIKSNDGSKTPGTDGVTFDDIGKLMPDEVVDKVRFITVGSTHGYRPKPVRRKEIPKPYDPAKTRPLGIPCVWDRLVQQCIKQVMEPICEAKFSENSYGFRPNRSAENAIARAEFLMQNTKLHYVVEFDVKGFFDNVDHSKLIKQIWSLGIRDKNLLFVLKRILKAPIRLEDGAMEYPTKGTPQGGIISPLLANIVLNELDQWVDSQWQNNPVTAKYKTSINANGSINKSNAYKFMRRTNLKEMYIVRYADDFRIFCRTKDEAERTMKAVTQWLMERLHLEVSPTKTRIVNVKHRYSEFLGFKMKVFRRANKYVIKAHIGDKQLEHARQKLVAQAKNIIHPKKEKHERGEISLYNSIVLGLQNYYSIATCISEDCSSLGRSVMTVLTNGLKERQGSRLVRSGRKLSVFESQKYGKSKSLRYVKGTDEPVYPISYVQHNVPLSRKRAINCYTPEGRKGLHDNLRINVNLMLALMRQPIGNRSVELADNRISLFSAQYGKCAVTGMPFRTTDEIHCHHINPRKHGGNDSYENLVLVNKLAHRLIHAETTETIAYYLEVCNLNKKQLDKLNALRLNAGLGEIRGTQPLKTNKVDCNRL